MKKKLLTVLGALLLAVAALGLSLPTILHTLGLHPRELTHQEQRFVTGQNQNSGHETAHQMMALIAKKP